MTHSTRLCSLRVIRSIKQMSEFSRRLKIKGKTIGFVPTMGALHKGHLSLVCRAHRENDFVVVSIFVNPIQFDRSEDLHKYPRNFKKDAALCRKEGVDVIFYPGIKTMYPAGFKAYVEVKDLSDTLCGKFRPGHFQGVTTVVAKLFNIVMPDTAYFGSKDAQQAIIIKKMAFDLNMPLKIKVMPTVRERSGLALSSRNIYLSPEQRKDALILYGALKLARHLIKQGKCDAQDIIHKMGGLINKKKNASVQYISIVNLKDLKPLNRIEDKVLVALAVWIGKTRLIDNLIINSNVKIQNPK